MYILQIIFSVLALIGSTAAIIISVKAWYKSRAIYNLQKYKFPKNVGDSKDVGDKRHERILNDKLATGNYQIEHIYEKNERDLIIVLGKIKK